MRRLKIWSIAALSLVNYHNVLLNSLGEQLQSQEANWRSIHTEYGEKKEHGGGG